MPGIFAVDTGGCGEADHENDLETANHFRALRQCSICWGADGEEDVEFNAFFYLPCMHPAHLGCIYKLIGEQLHS